ncbi:UvrABC system protein A [Rhynchospora pubera]|uniref:UvrABC system protein A n=1 Tax=Rhynchospora pubera TaxID=906938 RepID=A0AAV8EVA4_9POAL|nr:UvrABC system protein A [Rhynchospora pubera]
MDARTDKLIRRTTMVGAATAAYFFLTSDLGPHFNALDPIKRAIESAQFSLRSFVFGSDKEVHKETHKNANEKPKIDSTK